MTAELKAELTKEELWYIEYHGKCTEPSELGIKTALILTKLFQGMHHVPASQIKKINWKSESYIPFSYFASMSTYDDNLLTRLIILAHEYCVRVEIKACNFHYFTIQFSKRIGREGPNYDRHPTVEQAGLQEVVKQLESDKKCTFCGSTESLKAITSEDDDDVEPKIESCCYNCFNDPDNHMQDAPVDSMEWYSTDYNWKPISRTGSQT